MANPRHKKAPLIVLSGSGREALTAIQAAQGAWADRLGGKIGVTALRDATTVVDKARDLVAEGRGVP
jgi:hypothetical protein